MKKRGWLVLGLAAAVFLTLAFGAKAQAWTEFRSGDSATVKSNETVDSSFWAAAKNLDIAGTVNGDVFCAGQTVNISGIVKGDLICGAQTINLSGHIEGDVRLGAQTVNLTGMVDRNATIAAETLNADSKSRIGGDLSLAASSASLNGSIGRDLAAGGSSVYLNGSIGRDVKSGGDKLILGSNAKVSGSIDYTGKNKIEMANGAFVSGDIKHHQPQEKHHSALRLLFFSGATAGFVALMLLITALVVTALLPKVLNRVSQQGMERPGMSLLVGFGANIAVPIIIFMLVLTIVGIPLAIILLLMWLLINLSSGIFSAFWLGRRVWKTQHNAFLVTLTGSMILILLYFIPIISIFALVLACWLGEGMLLLELKNRLPKPDYRLK